MLLHSSETKPSWVHNTALGGVVQALTALMNYGLRGKSLPPRLHSSDVKHCIGKEKVHLLENQSTNVLLWEGTCILGWLLQATAGKDYHVF